ncbi:hypothetical protein PV04_10764 [Phialophora macrospora]|uniref:Transcription factor domain-containing protein n=1 Tax=Phialophora macrospora TaxID=1851006 RepID=A0A0D2FRI2_9EURO|nr:hypothetical protein PV04_10764 [Phialophora macrospora]
MSAGHAPSEIQIAKYMTTYYSERSLECTSDSGDMGMQILIPYSYIQSLHRRLVELGPSPPGTQEGTALSENLQAEDDTNPGSIGHRSAPSAVVSSEDTACDPSTSLVSRWGPSSALCHFKLVMELIGAPSHPSPERPSQTMTALVDKWFRGLPKDSDMQPCFSLPPLSVAKQLCSHYITSIETFTPIIGKENLERDVNEFYSLRDNGVESANLVIQTRVIAVLAIALQLWSFSRRGKRALGEQYNYKMAARSLFRAATSDLKTVLEPVHLSGVQNQRVLDHVLDQLQTILLLTTYLMVDPSQGNVWQLLGFADRLWSSTCSAHTLSHMSEGRRTRATLLRACFLQHERMVGTAFGRPIDEYRNEEEERDEGSLPSLWSAIWRLKAEIHALFLRANPRSRTALWETDLLNDYQADVVAWLDQWKAASQNAFVSSGNPNPSTMLYLCGLVQANEALHTVFCFILREKHRKATLSDSSGGYDAPFIALGQSFLVALLDSYGRLRDEADRMTPGIEAIGTLTYPFQWPRALEVIRAAATTIFLRHTVDRTLLAHEAVAVLKLLDDPSDGVDASIVIKELLDLLLT